MDGLLPGVTIDLMKEDFPKIRNRALANADDNNAINANDGVKLGANGNELGAKEASNMVMEHN